MNDVPKLFLEGFKLADREAHWQSHVEKFALALVKDGLRQPNEVWDWADRIARYPYE